MELVPEAAQPLVFCVAEKSGSGAARRGMCAVRRTRGPTVCACNARGHVNAVPGSSLRQFSLRSLPRTRTCSMV
eukprot:SAG11_NODE_34520_length_271_cov_1.122093_1_plen_73_part_10